MARPLKSGLDYFPHDCDASSDEKLEALMSVYKNDGYAFYFKLLERIYKTSSGELDLSNELELKVIIKRVGVSPKKFQNILETCLKLGLFDSDLYEKSKKISSESIKKRIANIGELRIKWRKSKEFSIEKTHIENPVENPIKKRKEKKSKGKESKVNINETENEENVSDIYNEFHQVFDYWNRLKIIEHSEAKDIYFDSYRTARESWSAKEICNALKNYATVLQDSKSYFKHRWTFEEFLRKGIDKFVNDESIKNFQWSVKPVDPNSVTARATYKLTEEDIERIMNIKLGEYEGE